MQWVVTSSLHPLSSSFCLSSSLSLNGNRSVRSEALVGEARPIKGDARHGYREECVLQWKASLARRDRISATAQRDTRPLARSTCSSGYREARGQLQQRATSYGKGHWCFGSPMSTVCEQALQKQQRSRGEAHLLVLLASLDHLLCELLPDALLSQLVAVVPKKRAQGIRSAP